MYLMQNMIVQLCNILFKIGKCFDTKESSDREMGSGKPRLTIHAKGAFLEHVLEASIAVTHSERPRRDERAEHPCELTFKEMLLVTSSRGTLVPMLLCPLFCLQR